MEDLSIDSEINNVPIKKKRGALPKQNLDYVLFPIAHSKYRKLLIAKFGAIGVGIFDELRIQIGGNREGGYFIHFDTDDFELLASNLKIEKDFLQNWFEFCLDKSIFSKELYEKYKIITSSETQENWILAARERKGFLEGIIEDYMLVDYTDALGYNQKRYPLKRKEIEITTNEISINITGTSETKINYN
ncbi:MAG: hypothetical protein RLZZ175_2793 [Bacteroidota bacterium]|jgi:hypothetical protein